ncbi:MAG: hypothetical protein KZQ93_06735 [Candidatus Thiodiazotropha sp. (ex Monitilora ramsayi)]|nr:hypothetical protein [Candidatus Thiodiazotropha sp. (ex Monitilora ramsayi)]
MAHINIALKAAECFSNDGKLDAEELDAMISLAEADGKITQEEVRVLTSVIKRIKPEEIDDAMKQRLEALEKKLAAQANQ